MKATAQVPRLLDAPALAKHLGLTSVKIRDDKAEVKGKYSGRNV